MALIPKGVAMHVIAIDGPAGVGKSTTARQLAQMLTELYDEAWYYLDTGSAYRGIAVAASVAGIDLDNPEVLAAFAGNSAILLSAGEVCQVGPLNVSDLLRSAEASSGASRVATNNAVRQQLNKVFRSFAASCHVVAEGRDMGTVVFPSAVLKLYLTASPRVRAERRYLQKPTEGTVDAIEAAIAERDHRDSTRADAPLMEADGAVVVDTGYLTTGQVCQRICELLHQRL